jgi:SPP1 gp7 family putative phage head morphogenesis protein
MLTDSSVIDLILRFFTGLEKKTSDNYIRASVSYLADKIDDFNSQNVENGLFDIKKISGIPGLPEKPTDIKRIFTPLKTAEKNKIMDGFISQNLDLIKTIRRDLVEDSKKTVINEIKAGNSPAMISETLEQKYKTSLSRAQFIAEDQVNKYTSDLTEIRHKALGIKRYTYRTMRDKRVRDACKVHEGKVYSYDSPPPGGKPGVKPYCRCYAEAKTSDLWEEAA